MKTPFLTTVRLVRSALVLGLVLGFTVAVAPSCGSSKPTAHCNKNNCAGCCDNAGQCYTGQSPEACGVDGITCLVCNTGQICQDGACRTPIGQGGGTGGGTGGGSTGGGTGGGSTGGGTGGGSTGGGTGGGGTTCGAATCQGCCDALGHCQAGTAATACGAGGASCKSCNIGGGESCTSGLCAGGCNSNNCTGCCSGNTCVDPASQSNAQCGLGAAACQTCQGSATCDFDAGTCMGGAGGGAGGGLGGGFGGSGGGLGIGCSLFGCTAGQCCNIDATFNITCVNDTEACIDLTTLKSGTCNMGVCQ